MNLRELTPPKKLLGGAVGVVVVSSFLPWVSIASFSVSGIRGDGKLTLLLALVTAAVLASHEGVTNTNVSERTLLFVGGICGGLTLIVALVDMSSYAGSGLWLTLIASVAWVTAIVLIARQAGVGAAEVSAALRAAAEHLDRGATTRAVFPADQVLPKVTAPVRTPVAVDVDSIVRTVEVPEAGRSCPYCRFPLKAGLEVVECGSCHAVHHDDCWRDGNGCATVGCAGSSLAPKPAEAL